MRAYYSVPWIALNAVLGGVYRWEVKGRERVPRTGGLIVASNHVSYWDPPVVGSAIPRETFYLAKEELFASRLFGSLISSYNSIPIRRGVADLSGMSRAVAALRDGKALLMFPEGSRMRDGELHPPRPGVGMMAVHADVPIVPCYISGSNRPRQWMLWRSRLRVWFGPAFKWQDLAGADTDLTPGRPLYQRIGEAVMREIAALRSGQRASATRGAA